MILFFFSLITHCFIWITEKWKYYWFIIIHIIIVIEPTWIDFLISFIFFIKLFFVCNMIRVKNISFLYINESNKVIIIFFYEFRVQEFFIIFFISMIDKKHIILFWTLEYNCIFSSFLLNTIYLQIKCFFSLFLLLLIIILVLIFIIIWKFKWYWILNNSFIYQTIITRFLFTLIIIQPIFTIFKWIN